MPRAFRQGAPTLRNRAKGARWRCWRTDTARADLQHMSVDRGEQQSEHFGGFKLYA